METTSFYKASGVDAAFGDEFSRVLNGIIKSTWNTRFARYATMEGAGFRSPTCMYYYLGMLPKIFGQSFGSDGVGTKGVLHAANGNLRPAAHDGLAMIWYDMARHGFLFVGAGNILDVKTLGSKDDPKFFNAFAGMVDELAIIAKKNDIILFPGETAELGICVSSVDESLPAFNWGLFAVAVASEEFLLPNVIVPGDLAVVFYEPTFRSNGISALRRALAQKFGPNWWKNEEAMKYISRASAPSTLFGRFFEQVNGWYHLPGQTNERIPIKSLVHITGGGIPGKTKDLLDANNVSLNLSELYDPSDIMQEFADMIADEMKPKERYETWNGGQAMLAFVAPEHASLLIERAKESNIQAKVGGEVIERNEFSVAITNRFKGKGYMGQLCY